MTMADIAGCCAEGCERTATRRGMCEMHYRRWRREIARRTVTCHAPGCINPVTYLGRGRPGLTCCADCQRVYRKTTHSASARQRVYLARVTIRTAGQMATADELELLLCLISEAEAAVADAITRMLKAGLTWREIGEAAGKSSPAVFRWYRRRVALSGAGVSAPPVLGHLARN